MRSRLSERDSEANRFSARAARYARVGANVGGVAAKIAATRFLGLDLDRGKNGQGVPVGVGQPTLRMERITVGGTGG